MDERVDITGMLAAASRGEREALEELAPLVYDELHRLAAARLRKERPDHTLQATSLADEVFVRLVDQQRAQWNDRAHFYATAARSLRRILVDHARAKQSAKRGGQQRRQVLEDVLTVSVNGDPALLDLDDALTRLAEEHPEKARIVELRFFGGLTAEEVAEVLGVAVRTVERRWEFARAWLYRALDGESQA